jgi:alpha-D-ribose 1-methylphosphonate 5-phosphate C-P lyase
MISGSQHRLDVDGLTADDSGAAVSQFTLFQPVAGVSSGNVQGIGGTILLVDVSGY